MDLAALKVFLEVVDAGSFSAAARRLDRSKAMVSRTVSDLENALSARLLNRTTRHISLTDQGARLAREARDLVARFDDLANELREDDGAPRGRLRVSGPRSFGETLLPRMAADYLKANPEVEIEMVLEDRFVDLVAEGFDLAIRIADLPDSSLIARRLAPSRQLVVASPEVIGRYGAPAHPRDLAALPCIVDTVPAHGRNWPFMIEGKRETVRVNGSLAISGAPAARVAALEGIGFSMLPGFAIAGELADGALVPVLVPFEMSGHGVYAVYANRKHLSAKVRSFMDHLTGEFAALAACFAPGQLADDAREKA